MQIFFAQGFVFVRMRCANVQRHDVTMAIMSIAFNVLFACWKTDKQSEEANTAAEENIG